MELLRVGQGAPPRSHLDEAQTGHSRVWTEGGPRPPSGGLRRHQVSISEPQKCAVKNSLAYRQACLEKLADAKKQETRYPGQYRKSYARDEDKDKDAVDDSEQAGDC